MKSKVTLEEYIAVLRRSRAPTLVVEGDHDYLAFREFEIENVEFGFTIFPVSGKNNVVSIISRLDEIGNERIAFLLDRDEWIAVGKTPFDDHASVIMTAGWSIENDLICDCNIKALMSAGERTALDADIKAFSQVFAVALQCFLDCVDGPDLTIHPHKVLSDTGQVDKRIEADWLRLYDVSDCLSFIQSDPHQFLRGKSLVALYLRQLSHKNRKSKYSFVNIMEIAAATRGVHLSRIERAVKDILNIDS